jgi:translation elongation factor aEF-1 beta
MGNVAFSMKITVEPDKFKQVKEKLNESLPQFGELKELSEEPVGFGIKLLKILVVFPERPGGTEEIEKTVLATDGVTNIESDTTLL